MHGPSFARKLTGLAFTSSTSDQSRDALPSFLTHGWPGSVVEFLRSSALGGPTSHGGKAETPFTLSFRRFLGWILRQTDGIWNASPPHCQRWAELMKRLATAAMSRKVATGARAFELDGQATAVRSHRGSSESSYSSFRLLRRRQGAITRKNRPRCPAGELFTDASGYASIQGTRHRR